MEKENNKKTEEKKVETEKKPVETPKVKKSEKKVVKKDSACVRGVNLPVSGKYSKDICKFIKGKTIQKAISELREVIDQKRAIPMKGEMAHRKGKMMSGKYPKNASEHFIKLLKTLSANSIVNGLEDPVIIEAVSNIGERPYGRFGSVRRKRTHIMIKVKSKPVEKEKPKVEDKKPKEVVEKKKVEEPKKQESKEDKK